MKTTVACVGLNAMADHVSTDDYMRVIPGSITHVQQAPLHASEGAHLRYA